MISALNNLYESFSNYSREAIENSKALVRKIEDFAKFCFTVIGYFFVGFCIGVLMAIVLVTDRGIRDPFLYFDGKQLTNILFVGGIIGGLFSSYAYMTKS